MQEAPQSTSAFAENRCNKPKTANSALIASRIPQCAFSQTKEKKKCHPRMLPSPHITTHLNPFFPAFDFCPVIDTGRMRCGSRGAVVVVVVPANSRVDISWKAEGSG